MEKYRRTVANDRRELELSWEDVTTAADDRQGDGL